MVSTALLPVPLVPEISLHLAGPEVGLFDATGGDFRSDDPPPFWAFVWAGGQALARFLLDRPEQVTAAGAFFRDHAVPSGQRTLAQLLERQRVNVALRQREAPRPTAFLTAGS